MPRSPASGTCTVTIAVMTCFPRRLWFRDVLGNSERMLIAGMTTFCATSLERDRELLEADIPTGVSSGSSACLSVGAGGEMDGRQVADGKEGE